MLRFISDRDTMLSRQYALKILSRFFVCFFLTHQSPRKVFRKVARADTVIGRPGCQSQGNTLGIPVPSASCAMLGGTLQRGAAAPAPQITAHHAVQQPPTSKLAGSGRYCRLRCRRSCWQIRASLAHRERNEEGNLVQVKQPTSFRSSALKDCLSASLVETCAHRLLDHD